MLARVRWGGLFLMVLIIGGMTGAGPVIRAMHGYATAQASGIEHPPAGSDQWSLADQGGWLALHGDFGALTTENLQLQAVPWKALVALSDVSPDAFGPGPDPFARFGIVTSGSMGVPHAERGALPWGWAEGTAHRSWPARTVQLAAPTCAACHAGRLWDSTGAPSEGLAFGVPNTALDLDALNVAVVKAISNRALTDEAWLAALKARFPEPSDDELQTAREVTLPAWRAEVLEKGKLWSSLHPWKNGGPGRFNGAAMLRESMVGALEANEYPAAPVRIPGLFEPLSTTQFGVDGSLQPATSPPEGPRVSLLLGHLPMVGIAAERSAAHAAQLERVDAFLKTLQPPKWPGPIDESLRARGEQLFASKCAGCHDGKTITPVEVLGTDTIRAVAFDEELLGTFNPGPLARHVQLVPTRGYRAGTLRGIWAQAPYLHNGSVPTLWAVLKPEERPKAFLSGGHSLDMKRVGVRLSDVAGADGFVYPPDVTPWSTPKRFDTAAPGCSNAGHEAQVKDLDDDARWALIEFLKTR